MASENNHTVAVDPEGTAAYGHKVVSYAGDMRTQRRAWLLSQHEQVQQLGPWASKFKKQMGHPDGDPTVETFAAAYQAGQRVAGGWEDHGNTAITHSQVMPQTDANHAAKLSGIEAQT